MSARGATPLRCDRLVKRFGDVTAIDRLDLHLDAGEVVALIGLNGAGKTTFMRLALAMIRPDGGTASVFGRNVATAGPDRWRAVGQMIEPPFAYPELTVAENLWAAARLHGLSRSQAPGSVTWVIERLGLGGYADRRSSALSLGNRQRLGLASALVHSPRLLILDEPTSALDPAGVVLLRDLVQEAARTGAAVLVSSHHLDEVARVADRVEVIHRGRLVGELPPRGLDLEHAFFEMVRAADLDATESSALGGSSEEVH
ncbi:MAG: ABC transporter ATP-binding protein [Microlunatus sp.]|nr:ABC transporter ATP-binding protein [Microlunatus sp.]